MSVRAVFLVTLLVVIVSAASVCMLGCKRGVGDAPAKAPVAGGPAVGGGPPPGAPIGKGDPSAVPASGKGGPFASKMKTEKTQ